MAHYEMYFCLPSSAYSSAVGTKIKALYPIVESVADDGTVTYKSAPTWEDIIFKGKVGPPRYSHDKGYCIIKGEWSMKEGVLSELAALGASVSYPSFSVLTKSEAQTLSASSIFTGE